MRFFKQIRTITLMSIGSVSSRASTSLVVVLGVAGVVAVLISTLSMATGLERTIANSGSDIRAVVVRAGSASENLSSLDKSTAAIIKAAPGIALDTKNHPIASAEALRTVALRLQSSGSRANVALRGVGPENPVLRPEFRIVEGRMFRPGVRELIVGQSAEQQFSGLAIGDLVNLSNTVWSVVGVFRTGGGIHESELIADTDTVLAAYKRNSVQSVTVKLQSEQSFAPFKAYLSRDPRISVNVQRETELFKHESAAQILLIHALAYFVGGIMALGAVFAALNTMYSAVSTRSVEIATLRAIGFNASSIVISVLVEALLLSIIGAALGALIAWLLFDGKGVTSLNPGTFTQLAFQLDVTPQLVVVGTVWACVVGLIGGLLPAIRAARLPIATVLQRQA